MSEIVKISVVTVVFNDANNLQRTIDSVVSQIYPNVEYIVVDGGSTDGTLDIIKRNEFVISKWISEKDKGIYDAMNKGIALSTGDYIIFMNAGDLFYSEESISECLLATPHCYPDIIYGDYFLNGSRRNDGLIKAKHINQLPRGMICSHQSMFFKRECLINEIYDLEYRSAADYDLIFRLFLLGKLFHKVDCVISFYQAGGVSDVNRTRSVKERMQVLKKYGAYRLRERIYLNCQYVRAWLVQKYVSIFE